MGDVDRGKETFVTCPVGRAESPRAIEIYEEGADDREEDDIYEKGRREHVARR